MNKQIKISVTNIILDSQGRLSEEVTFEVRTDRASHVEIILGRGKSKCKGCEAGVCLAWRNKEVSVTGGQ